jgi:hypothetical protein
MTENLLSDKIWSRNFHGYLLFPALPKAARLSGYFLYTPHHPTLQQNKSANFHINPSVNMSRCAVSRLTRSTPALK